MVAATLDDITPELVEPSCAEIGADELKFT